MDGATTKSPSFETLVIRNIANVSVLKAKLNEIISLGKDYEFDVSCCLKALLRSEERGVAPLAVRAVAALAAGDSARARLAHRDIVQPILATLAERPAADTLELHKQCCRALGNLCCDCDEARRTLLDCDGVPVLDGVLDASLRNGDLPLDEIKLLACKTLLNFAIGGDEFAASLLKSGVVETLARLLTVESEREVMADDLVSTLLILLSVINENDPELLYEEVVNLAVYRVLKETTNVEVSELCLEHLHTQAEHDSVKILLAREGAVNLVCQRLEQLQHRHHTRDADVDDSDVTAVMKHACDLIIIVLTGDEAMDLLYDDGEGEVYRTTVRWLDAGDPRLLATAVLAVGNFARRDRHCVRMMGDAIFDKILDIFERHARDGDAAVRHAALAALRNLAVPAANKPAAARAAPPLLAALPALDHAPAAYRLLAALRMLLDGQRPVARQLAESRAALQAVARWGAAEGAGGAAAEAPRLLAWAARLLPGEPALRNILLEEGCVACLVRMLAAPHALMQNEALLALLVLAAEPGEPLAPRLLAAGAAEHVALLLRAGRAKLPPPAIDNAVALLELTGGDARLAAEYARAGVGAALAELLEARRDVADETRARALRLLATLVAVQ